LDTPLNAGRIDLELGYRTWRNTQGLDCIWNGANGTAWGHGLKWINRSSWANTNLQIVEFAGIECRASEVNRKGKGAVCNLDIGELNTSDRRAGHRVQEQPNVEVVGTRYRIAVLSQLAGEIEC